MVGSRGQGVLHAHMAALLFGGTALFAKWIPLSVDIVTFWRAAIAMIVMVILCRFSGRSFRLERRRDVVFQIGLGVVLGLHWATYYAAIQYSTIAIGIAALFVAPVFSVLFESAMRRQWPDLTDLLLCGLVFFGVVLLIPDFEWESGYLKGVLLGMLSACLLTLRQNLHRRSQAKKSSGLVLLFYQLIGISVIFVVPAINAGGGPVMSHWSSLLILGVFFTALPHYFNVCALRELEAKSVLIITSLMLPYGIIIGVVFLREVPSLQILLGCGLIMAAATAENLRLGAS